MKPTPKDLSLFGIIKEGIKAVPQVKYALGIAAISAVVMMVATFSIDLRVTVWGTLILLAL